MNNKETPEQVKDLTYWKNNAEEDYITTPISVLRYISELEKERTFTTDEMEFIKKCIKVYWEYHSNRVHPDNQEDWNISQSIINDTLSKQQDNGK